MVSIPQVLTKIGNLQYFNLGEKRTRDDLQCGREFLLPDGSPTECYPKGALPCCSEHGWCHQSNLFSGENFCSCSKCSDSRVLELIRRIQRSGRSIKFWNGHGSIVECSIIRFGGFLKQACFEKESKQISFKCTHSKVFYRRPGNTVTGKIVGATNSCKNDNHAYQACGFDTVITNGDVLCGGYICPSVKSGIHKYIDCGKKCSDMDRDTCVSAHFVDPTICNDICDGPKCEDESQCNGYKYGVYCDSGKYVPVYRMCSIGNQCEDGKEDRDCDTNVQGIIHCPRYRNKRLYIPLHNHTRCAVFDEQKIQPPYCFNYLDQTNCSDSKRIGGFCTINGYMSSVSKYVLCGDSRKTSDVINLCDHQNDTRFITENVCVSTSTNCKVHKHRMCNNEYDCPDKSDEFDDLCKSITVDFSCNRTFYPYQSIHLPVAWVRDGVPDCADGEDEILEKWEFCGDKSEGTRRVRLPSEDKCENVFFCPSFEKHNTYVPLELLCDGVESCDTENKICRIARDLQTPDTVATRNGSTLNFCDTKSNTLQGVSCNTVQFDRLPGDVEVFGANKNEIIHFVNIPVSKIDCSSLFGEFYVYLSCLNLCTEPTAACPLSDEKPLMYDLCPGQFPDRVNTLANNSFLTFARESDDGQFYHQNYFQCRNRKCIDFDKVCDLVDDCGDQSDEDECTNHMICEDTLNETKQHFIAIGQRCDGIYDCFDLSDECNSYCRPKEILSSVALKCFCWFMGIVAVVLNTLVVIRGLYSLGKCETGGTLMTQTLVCLIGSGDVLIGLYLILLSVYDSIIFGKDFCRQQVEWLAGNVCATLGVISTFGSQLSLFAMTVLSLIRAYGLISNRLKPPGKTNKKAILKAVLTATGVVASSLAIAVIPLVPTLEDYFVQGMFYDPSYKVFIGFPNKVRHIEVLQAYFNNSLSASLTNTSMASTSTPITMSWNEIGADVDKMFSQQYGQLERNPVHFYGNDGYCLFKYFVRSDDARRSREAAENSITDVQGDMIVWVMLGLNFACFFCITICYICINVIARRSSQVSASDKDATVKRRQKEIQAKVTVIVVTDFLCWVPFIIVSALHNWNKIDATFWYGSFAMTVIPLNSAINPVVYDNKLRKFVLAMIKKFINSLCRAKGVEDRNRKRGIPLSMKTTLQSHGLEDDASEQ